MRNKILFLLSISVLATLLAACVAPVSNIPATINVQPQPQQRTLTVTGSGMVTLTPDIAYVSIGVHTQNASATNAMNENNTMAQSVMNVIKGFSVDDKDIQTTNFSIYPQQQYDDKGNITGILYVVDNTVYVTVRDLTKLGELLDAVVRAGANNINSISFDVADKAAALSQARLAAVQNARQQADELASATGVSVGDVQTISYYDSTAPTAIQYARADMAGAPSSVPVSAGSMQITTTVTIVYEIK